MVNRMKHGVQACAVTQKETVEDKGDARRRHGKESVRASLENKKQHTKGKSKQAKKGGWTKRKIGRKWNLQRSTSLQNYMCIDLNMQGFENKALRTTIVLENRHR